MSSLGGGGLRIWKAVVTDAGNEQLCFNLSITLLNSQVQKCKPAFRNIIYPERLFSFCENNAVLQPFTLNAVYSNQNTNYASKELDNNSYMPLDCGTKCTGCYGISNPR
jgi:argininosuccinate synthase